MSNASDDADWEGVDLEQAYLRALSALESVEATLPPEVAEPDEVMEDAISSLPFSQNSIVESDEPAITSKQVIEACLFVGGSPLTARKLASVLGHQTDPADVAEQIDSLNSLFALQNRPCEIQLGEGGYQLVLKPEFEGLRAKVYGIGPKDVRLSQESLEILALVAYHQPVSEEELAELGRPKCGAILRQLLRRELIHLNRSPEDPKRVDYSTSERFLGLFGLKSLNELPRPEQLLYK